MFKWKVAQVFSNIVQKVGKNIPTVAQKVAKRGVFQNILKSCPIFGLLLYKICLPKISQIAQSGHTVSKEPKYLTKIWLPVYHLVIFA